MRSINQCQAEVIEPGRARAIRFRHRCPYRAIQHREGLDLGERVSLAVCGRHAKAMTAVMYRTAAERNR